jgi:hypothetical protein
MSKEKEAYSIEQAYEDLQRGIELGINDLTSKLHSSIKELSKSELERSIKAIIDYPNAVNVYSKKEELFVKDLVALRGLHLQAELQSIAELQKQGDENGEEAKDSTIG